MPETSPDVETVASFFAVVRFTRQSDALHVSPLWSGRSVHRTSGKQLSRISFVSNALLICAEKASAAPAL